MVLRNSIPQSFRKLVHSKRGVVSARREYHDQSFGFRERREYVFPDYTLTQLKNRSENAHLLRYVDSMRTHGHRAAKIDPLDFIHRDDVASVLGSERYGLKDDNKRYDVNGILWTKRVGEYREGEGEEFWTLKEIKDYLTNIYVGNVGYEFMHSPSKTERRWFSHLLESQTLPSSEDKPLVDLNADMKKRILGLLTRSEVFDNFLQHKFPNLKRYGLEGGESMLPALDFLFHSASLAGIRNVILAMPHRGRLNFLTDILQYPPAALFHKIKGGSEFPDELDADGDVLSHLVSSPELSYGGEETIKVALQPNPSHLEAVNPIALGKTRAKQYALLKISPQECQLGDRVMCVQIHGDASFIGQGIVMESLGLSNLPHFTSGGSIHLVVDNNIGYTTPASNSRSSLYCTDVGKMINTPILHVNGDHPEDVAKAMDIAFRYRNYFRKDIIVDLLVYRRWGHNELDIPNITNPIMYEKIAARKSVPQLYEEKLISEGVVSVEDISELRASYKSHLDVEHTESSSYTPPDSSLKEQWGEMVWSTDRSAIHEPETGVEKSVLDVVGKASIAVPEDFEVHPKIVRHVKNRLQSIESGAGVDFATAEALAFGSLMQDGIDVRLSGQDVGRGTFSQRHAMLVNQKTEGVVVPLNDELKADGKLELVNSSLSEMAVLGFEYGTSWERPNLLPIWEAQFGDFFNGAQVIIDTFISSAETKWLKQSGIVLLLPHGLDGAGPEHSSSRIERMLQLTNDRFDLDAQPPNINMHVVFPTTASQYFHLLRRQMLRNYRKPLVIASPKGLLRLPAATSPISEMESGTRFQPVLVDPITDKLKAQRVVLLTGKIYYEAVKERQLRNLIDNVALVRIEELAPFPFRELEDALRFYPNATEYVWFQEEPRNQGAYPHVAERISSILRHRKLNYVGRKESSVPATGTGKLYRAQQKSILDQVFSDLTSNV